MRNIYSFDVHNEASSDSEADDEEMNGNGDEASVDGDDGKTFFFHILSATFTFESM